MANRLIVLVVVVLFAAEPIVVVSVDYLQGQAAFVA